MSTTVEIQASSLFYELEGWNNSLNNYESSGVDFIVGQDYHDSTQFDWRTLLRFGLYSIPKDAFIEQVNLQLTATVNLASTAFNVLLVNYDWSGASPNAAAYAAVLAASTDQIWAGSGSVSAGTPIVSPNLNTAWIKAQVAAEYPYLYYGVVSSRDKAGDAPSGQEYMRLASKSHGTAAYRPVLSVKFKGLGRKFYISPIVG